MTDKIQLLVELKPFSVPNYVIQKVPDRLRHDGFVDAPVYHLSQLDKHTLKKLCDDFRDNVFKKAAIPEFPIHIKENKE